MTSYRAAAFALAFAMAGCGGEGKKVAPTPSPDKEGPSKEELEAESEAKQIGAITGALNEFGPAVHTCWSQAAADDFRLQGSITLGITMLGEGKSEVSLLEDKAGDEVLSECLLKLWREYQWPAVFAHGDAVQLPPFEFVAPDAQFMVSQAHVEMRSFANAKVQSQRLLSENNTGNAGAALRLIRILPGGAIPMHSHQGDELLYVFAGSGLLDARAGKGRLEAGSAVYLPSGTPYSLAQAGESPLQVVHFSAPADSEKAFENVMTPEDPSLLGKVPKRGPKALVRKGNEAGVFPILSGKASVAIFFDALSGKENAAYLGVLEAQPGASVPLHRHGDSSEYLFVLEGEAEMYINARKILVRAGDGIQIPPGIEHGVTVVGEQPLKAVQLYTPPGPEQRFKNGS